ncbi:ABC transporter substrate-binding protein [Isoptericola sp. NPDC056605]|uniref:ABC transporter substrate-binding protein n=1 Tax=Isoptericola sp. NPDC056605 TaxID=3345876 RepID=UPI0036CED3D4
MTTPRVMRTAPAFAAAALLLAACSGGGGDDAAEEVDTLTFWTAQTTPERVAAQEEIASRFTEETGIDVEVVPLAGADQNTTLLANAASGEVPDVILHGWEQSPAWVDQGILDQDAAAELVESLGPDTFADGAMSMVTVDDQPSGVPMDGWGYLLLYRADQFEKAGVEPPESLADVADAAEAMRAAGDGGIALGTQPGDAWAGETLEATLLPNGCQLAEGGTVTLDSDACVEGLELYQRMAATAGNGELDVDAARASYLAGDSSMVMFSTHILDEVAGFDPNNPVTCDECADDPTYLSANTGVVTGLFGPSNDDAVQFGNVLQLSIPEGAQTEAAKQYVEFLMTEGYADSLGMATEGRIPTRLGTPDDPTEYVDAWATLPFGADGGDRSITDVYGQDVANALATGAEQYVRWGAGTQDALLASVTIQQQVVPQTVGPLFSDGDPAQVADDLRSAVETVQQDLE